MAVSWEVVGGSVVDITGRAAAVAVAWAGVGVGVGGEAGAESVNAKSAVMPSMSVRVASVR